MGTEIEPVLGGKELKGYPIPPDQVLYHWSPKINDESILARGLRIRSKSQHAPIRYPMICLCLDPIMAWSMSAASFSLPPQHWSLWGVHAGDAGGFEVIPFDDNSIREVRVYHSIAPIHLYYIGSNWAPGTEGQDAQ